MDFTANTQIIAADPTPPVARALAALRRDIAKTLAPTEAPGAEIRLQSTTALPPECYTLAADAPANALTLAAGDDLGFVYGLYEISRRFLGVQPFWFWLDQRFTPVPQRPLPDDYAYTAAPAAVRYRGWFINDETLLSHWVVERRPEGPWEMAFEALLRLGGNLVIPGTGANAHRYRALAAEFGLILTHHHAEPLGAPMFANVYPDLEPQYSRYPAQFRALWQQGIAEQRGCRVVWNLAFRGQGDRPFWADDPQYDTPQKRGALISRLLREQYDLVRAADPNAVCCTNLYGETMELYRQGWLDLPEGVITIWADNGYGKMVSRRQGSQNPRVPALPAPGAPGRHGIYYHASFYDLQAASHITALPNSAEFVAGELAGALRCGAGAYWLVNCSNIRPHTYLLDLAAALWRSGTVDPAAHRRAYAAAYYGPAQADAVAACLAGYAQAALPYGPHPDDHAGDQFYNHVPRMLISHYLARGAAHCGDLLWLTDAPDLAGQNAWVQARMAQAVERYDRCQRQCEAVYAALPAPGRRLFADTLLLQARLYALWAAGGLAVCQALAAALAGEDQRGFYLAGRAKRAYTLANRTLRDAEHGKWVDFYANECQTDVKQTAALCAYLMSFLRNRGEGPHFFAWQRAFQDSEADRRVLLILNTENHPTDDELWLLMEQQLGE